jgi:hypothetical protein
MLANGSGDSGSGGSSSGGSSSVWRFDADMLSVLPASGSHGGPSWIASAAALQLHQAAAMRPAAAAAALTGGSVAASGGSSGQQPEEGGSAAEAGAPSAQGATPGSTAVAVTGNVVPFSDDTVAEWEMALQLSDMFGGDSMMVRTKPGNAAFVCCRCHGRMHRVCAVIMRRELAGRLLPLPLQPGASVSALLMACGTAAALGCRARWPRRRRRRRMAPSEQQNEGIMHACSSQRCCLVSQLVARRLYWML